MALSSVGSAVEAFVKAVDQGILFMVENDFVTGTIIDVDGGALLA